MATLARLKDPEISNGNAINADDLDSEFNQLVTESNAQDVRLTNIESNAITLAGVKTFSSTPLMNAIDESTAGSGVTIDSLLIKDAGLRFTDAGELTIATGAVTATGSYHTIDTESDAASDDLDTISGGTAGALLIIQAENDARSVVLKHNTGNLLLANGQDITLDEDDYAVTLIYSAALSKWCQVASSLITPATQAQQETGTITTASVTPGRQQYHASASKAWVYFVGTGTVTINKSYNVTSITDNGTGDYTINFTTAFSDANYCGTVGGYNTAISDGLGNAFSSATSPTASLIRMKGFDTAGNLQDQTRIYAAFFGDQ